MTSIFLWGWGRAFIFIVNYKSSSVTKCKNLLSTWKAENKSTVYKTVFKFEFTNNNHLLILDGARKYLTGHHLD